MSELVKREPPSSPAIYEPGTERIWIDEYLDDKQGEISKYLQIGLRRKVLVVSVTAIVFVAAAAWTFSAQRWYTSSVNLQIDPEQAVLPYKEMYDSVTGDPRYLNTQAQVLKSEALASRIVLRLGLASNSESAITAAREFSARLTVVPVEGTQVVKVTYRSEDPVFAAKAVNTLADAYVDYGFETKRDATTKAKDFLQEELGKLQQKLEQSEERLVTYGREHSILLPSESNNVIMQKLSDLNQEMTKVEAEVLANQSDSLKGTTLSSFPEKLKTGVMRELDSRRSILEQKLATLTRQFGPKWPEVLTLNRELSEVQQQLTTEMQKALDQARVEYKLAVAHRERLAQAVETQGRLADRLTQDLIQFNILKREVETDRQLHEGLLQRLRETDISAGLKSANVHVIDRGRVPRLPSSPNIPLNLALGLTFGLLSGMVIASATEFLDRTIKTPEDVERDLRLPYLGAIPAFDKAWKEANESLLLPLKWHSPNASYYANPAASVYWESYRAVRASLQFSAPEKRPRSILVTSSQVGEGKSTTTVNLAITLAQTGARTIILETDMRRPRLAAMLRVGNHGGMSSYLSGQGKLAPEIRQTVIPNLFVVVAGLIPPNPAELVGSRRMSAALELLRQHFDYVIVDGPPLMPVTDALVMSSQVDGVMLVVNGKTPRASAQKARNLLRSVEARVLGVLINDVKLDVSNGFDAAYFSGYHDTSSTHMDVGGPQ